MQLGNAAKEMPVHTHALCVCANTSQIHTSEGAPLNSLDLPEMLPEMPYSRKLAEDKVPSPPQAPLHLINSLFFLFGLILFMLSARTHSGYFPESGYFFLVFSCQP